MKHPLVRVCVDLRHQYWPNTSWHYQNAFLVKYRRQIYQGNQVWPKHSAIGVSRNPYTHFGNSNLKNLIFSLNFIYLLHFEKDIFEFEFAVGEPSFIEKFARLKNYYYAKTVINYG